MTAIDVLKERVAAKLAELNVSARQVSLVATGQPAAVRNILAKDAMPHIDRLDAIAKVLGTTSDWLLGRDSATDGNSSTSQSPPHILLRVQLPSEAALTEMFEGLVEGIDLSLPKGDIARLLARRLPIGLAQLHDVMPDPLDFPDQSVPASRVATPAKLHPAQQS